MFKISGLRFSRTLFQSQCQKRLSYFTPFTKQNYKNYNVSKVLVATKAAKEKPNMALTFLGVLGVSSLYLVAHKPILCDTGYANQPVIIDSNKPTNIYYDDSKAISGITLRNRLNYHHVAMGSIAGLILGYAISRLSSVLFVLAIGVYLLGVYLRKQGIVIVDTKGIVKGAVGSVAWDELVFGQSSFSIPFILSFLTAATL
jgi:uncharacterized membrane protein (Fun14 family)